MTGAASGILQGSFKRFAALALRPDTPWQGGPPTRTTPPPSNCCSAPVCVLVSTVSSDHESACAWASKTYTWRWKSQDAPVTMVTMHLYQSQKMESHQPDMILMDRVFNSFYTKRNSYLSQLIINIIKSCICVKKKTSQSGWWHKLLVQTSTDFEHLVAKGLVLSTLQAVDLQAITFNEHLSWCHLIAYWSC